MAQVTCYINKAALAEMKRLAKEDRRSLKNWLTLYLDRTFGHVSLPVAPAQPPMTILPLPLRREDNLPERPFDITCTQGRDEAGLYPPGITAEVWNQMTQPERDAYRRDALLPANGTQSASEKGVEI